MKDLIILRGVPDAGKSTIANMMVTPECICTADGYLMLDGEYVWNYERTKEAHKQCRKKAKQLMHSGASSVVIANTNTEPLEFKFYEDTGKANGYRIHYLVVENRENRLDLLLFT